MKSDNFKKYKDNYSFGNKTRRLLWQTTWFLLFRPFGLPIFHRWRRFVLRLFGAKIGRGSKIYASVRIWAPWNLEIGILTAVGPHCEIYNPGKVVLGNKVVISQYSFLCTATHDYTTVANRLYWKNITVGDYGWVAARAFIGPGVNVGEYAIVGATASVYKDVEPYCVVGGNPARIIKKRIISENEQP